MKKMILILGTLLSFNTYADDWTSCGEDANGDVAHCRYKIENGTLTIQGVGENGNIGYWEGRSTKEKKAPWMNFVENIQNVVIEDSIRDLGYRAFTNLQLQTSLTIPSSIDTIPDFAFHLLSAPEVIIPDTITSIGSCAFCWTQISKIDIPDSVTSIGDDALRGTLFNEIIMSKNVSSLGAQDLSWSQGLEMLVIGENTILSDDVFDPYAGEGWYFNKDNLVIYCLGNENVCKQNVGESLANNVKQATSKIINGVTYVFDKNGKLVATSGHRAEKRIYTIEEANAVAKPTGNRVSIRYR